MSSIQTFFKKHQASQRAKSLIQKAISHSKKNRKISEEFIQQNEKNEFDQRFSINNKRKSMKQFKRRTYQKKNMSKHSETTDSYHNLLNDPKSHTIEKIQKMKNVENDQRRKKFRLSILQITKKIDESRFLKKRYFNKEFFQFDKDFVNYKINQQRILNKNFYFSFFYETLSFKKEKKRQLNYKNFYFSSFHDKFFFNIFEKFFLH